MCVCDLIAGCVARHNHLYPEDYVYESDEVFTEKDMQTASYDLLLLLNGQAMIPCYISYLALFRQLDPIITDDVNLECEKLLILLTIHPQSYNYATDLVTISAVFYILTIKGFKVETLLTQGYKYDAKKSLCNLIHIWIKDLESHTNIDTDCFSDIFRNNDCYLYDPVSPVEKKTIIQESPIRRVTTCDLKTQVSEGRLIGAGAASQVYATNHSLAIKTITVDEMAILDVSDLIKEIVFLSTLNHINVIDIRHFALSDQTVYIATNLAVTTLHYLLYPDEMTFMNRQELWSQAYINHGSMSSHLDKETQHRYMTDLLNGLNYIHSMGLIHQDIKAVNVLVMDDGRLTIADFGSAQICSDQTEPMINEIGTIYERDVNLTMDRVRHGSYSCFYSFEVDVWSMGTVLLEIITGIKPFHVPIGMINTGQEYSYILDRINQVLTIDNPLQCIDNAKHRKLILKMLTYNRNDRITSHQALIYF